VVIPQLTPLPGPSHTGIPHRTCKGIVGSGALLGRSLQVDSAIEVDRLTEHMRSAGTRVTKEPVDAEFFTGRSAYLCHLEDNYFEIAWADMPTNPVVIASRRAAGL
jgi:hypothetical protein